MKKTILLFTVLSTLFILSACSLSIFSDDEVEDTSSNLEENIEAIEQPDLDDDDSLLVVTAIDATISFSNSAITSTSDDVTISDNLVTIDTEGTYELTGESAQTTIYVDASSDDTITFVLNNLDLSSSTGPIFYIENADKVIINVKAGSTNTLTDLSDSEYDKDAIIYAKDDLSINGTGSLTINAGLQKGIKANDDLVINATTLSITSEGHAIKANNKITISDVDLTIDSNSDGIQSDNEDDATESLIYLMSGTYDIYAYGDAISSSYDLTIFSGTYTLYSGYQNSNTSDTSAKSIKADHSIYLVDGTFDITSSEDAIHSDDGLMIFNGVYTIDAADDGIHANQSLTIQDGTFYINEAYEGLEGKYIDISGGLFYINASDDGINASDPDISSTVADVPNGGTASSSTSTAVMTISGGTFYITSDDDSIDANGTITITGGSFYINGPTSGMQSLVDYDIDFYLEGSTFIGVSGYGNETKYPSDESTQVSITYNTGSTQASGSTIALLDEDNHTILTFTTTKSYQVIFLTSPELEENQTYTLTINGITEDTFTLDEITNTFNVSSSSTNTPPRR